MGSSSVWFSSRDSPKTLLPSSLPWFFFGASSSLVSTCGKPEKSRNSKQMPAERKCRACGQSLRPDYRNHADQAFCPRPACRRQRRAEAQRQRRKHTCQDDPLTRRLKPSEARWLRKNPMLVGLVSVLIGSTDWQDIEAFCAAASLRGRKILDGTILDVGENTLKTQGQNERRSL